LKSSLYPNLYPDPQNIRSYELKIRFLPKIFTPIFTPICVLNLTKSVQQRPTAFSNAVQKPIPTKLISLAGIGKPLSLLGSW
jgi:hypothetical protein